MEITVKNIGPISEGHVKIHPLTVFAGPSNSGKTFMATAIYAAAKAISNKAEQSRWMRHYLVESMRLNTPPLNSQKSRILQKINNLIEREITELSTEMADELQRCFGVPVDQIITNTPTGRPKRDRLLEVSCDQWALRPINEPNVENPSAKITDNGKWRTGISEIAKVAWKIKSSERSTYMIFASEGLVSSYAGECQFDPVYLPAERGGLMQSWETIAASIVKNAPRAIFGTNEIVSPKGSIADFLVRIINPKVDLSYQINMRLLSKDLTANEMGGYKKLHGMISTSLQGISDGKISFVKNKSNPVEIEYQTSLGLRLPLKLAGSAVTELAPIALVNDDGSIGKQSIFILEEPESHLHPTAQRRIVELLVRMAAEGIPVIITTHSPVILDQLSTFARAASLSKRKKRNIMALDHPATDIKLRAEDIGVYHFDLQTRGSRKGSVVRKIGTDEIRKDGILIPITNGNGTICIKRNAD